MTNLEMVMELTNIINDLLASGLNSCNVHEAKMQLDYLFDEYEEGEGENVEVDEALSGVKENGNAKQYLRIIENGLPVLIDENEWCENEQL